MPRFSARRPRPPLDLDVELLWHVEGEPETQLEKVLPFGKAQLFVNLRDDELHWVRASDDRVRLPGLAVQGPLTRPLLVDPRDQRSLVGASFRAGGLSAFSGPPVVELRDQLVELSLARRVAGPRSGRVGLERLRAGIVEARGPEARLDALERLLLALFDPERRIPPAVREAARRLEATGDLKLRALTDELGVTGRSFSDRFRAALGMRPKTWQRVRRFRQSLGLLEAGLPATEVAHALGYADQAHFNHEFRHFSDHTPVAYLGHPRAYQGHLAIR